jgi:hypothetical protein
LANGIKWTSEYLYRALDDVGVDAEVLKKVQSNGTKNLDFGKQELIKYLADTHQGSKGRRCYTFTKIGMKMCYNESIHKKNCYDSNPRF